MFSSVKNLASVLRAGKYSDFPDSERSSYVKMSGQYVPVILHPLDGYLVSGWENITEGLKALTGYVTDLFNTDVSEVFVSDDSFKMIEWVNRRQTTPLKKVVYMAAAWSPCSSEDEMNYILRGCRHWLSGGCPRLKLFCANTGSVDILQVLAGLRQNAVFVENRRDYTSTFGHQWTFWDGYDIKRSDGVTATVHYEPLGALVIAVWPETTYNYN
ncbi:hypothetical protein CRE_29420 [Caenorhabditis remanei]|uniref:F-box associated domain-containing protein n=1 Tax=Caenorhabditis remanei TaxID=31234 RepID=E3NX13_CAERE|nr:hypothetical protein CRE_29420 [Caenorhabditis remanei]